MNIFRFLIYHFAKLLARFANFIGSESLLKTANQLTEFEAMVDK